MRHIKRWSAWKKSVRDGHITRADSEIRHGMHQGLPTGHD